MVPCLNEEHVIRKTLARLESVSNVPTLTLLIDDGSTDRTAEVVAASNVPDLLLYRRQPPEARLGKGAALNAGLRWLLDSGHVNGWHPDNVILCILDADGRLEVSGLPRVLREFTDPLVGATQIGVRIGDRRSRLLLRLQDMEFVAYTRIFQVPRGRYGNALLGGNGQFTRLSALLSLGPEPWTDCLTEDVDLGVRLFVRGWRTRFVPEVTVEQEGVTAVRRLIGQRSRWFQGTLQTWRLLPGVARRRPWHVEFVNALLSPALILVTSLMILSLTAYLLGALVSSDAGSLLLRPAVILPWYVLTFAPAILFGLAYRQGSEVGRAKAFVLAHVFILYSLIWVAAAWRGIGRIVMGRHSWLKTERSTPVHSPTRRRTVPVLATEESAEGQRA
jgi:cellulose synthase/poly-beta-1,6-N-acetylglucosamine synthase-like glycosyltransferase